METHQATTPDARFAALLPEMDDALKREVLDYILALLARDAQGGEAAS